MADVPLVPERNIFQRYYCIPAEDTRQATQAFPCDRIPLVRHGRTPLLALTEELLDFEYFRSLEVTKLRCPALDTRPNQRQRRAKLRVAIALNDLGRDIRSLQPESFADSTLDRRIQMRVGPDRSAQFPDTNSLRCLRQPFLSPPEF